MCIHRFFDLYYCLPDYCFLPKIYMYALIIIAHLLLSTYFPLRDLHCL
jgi:hypothetical protein